MNRGDNLPLAVGAGPGNQSYPRALRAGLLVVAGFVAVSLILALLLPEGYLLAFIGDVLETGLVAVATGLFLRNFLSTQAQVRGFWFLLFLGSAMWLASLMLWLTYELWYREPAPDIPLADILLFVKLVPFTAAAALEPHKRHDSRFRAFGLLDVSILIIYSLYLFTFFVYGYRLIPGAADVYNAHFNLADAVGNQIFVLVAGISVLRADGAWRGLYRVYFFSAATYCLASDVSNVAIDLKRYYTGSLYDVPLTAAMAGFVCLGIVGRSIQQDLAKTSAETPDSLAPRRRLAFLASHLAMIVTLSTPVIGLWLLNHGTASEKLFPFRLSITLVTIFLLTSLLSIKQDLLSATLIGSLERLSSTYTSINRFKNQLIQSEKLASLGELVAQVANQIKNAMTLIRQGAGQITTRPDSDIRVGAMAGKIGQYAQRTDTLVENMLRFAQETPLQMTELEVKPLLESAIHLSRVAKLPDLRVEINQARMCPLVRGDSSQLLHVFLQIISNAVDALEEVGGGSLEISIHPAGDHACIQFADSGPGIKEPEHVFEPFYTTKPVGKGTGLGLSTCYGIVQQHEGEITCRNRPEGGALFTILLPAAPAEHKASLIPSPEVVEGAR
jgi:signal transduction histidine kinase